MKFWEAMVGKREANGKRLPWFGGYKDPEDVIEEARPGDLIQYERVFYGFRPYDHWGVYVGDGRIINVEAPKFAFFGKTALKLQTVSEVAAGRKCRVSNYINVAFAHGWKAFSNEETVARAHAEMKKGDAYPYSLFHRNCEHFVSTCKFGNAFCGQVAKFKEDMVRRFCWGEKQE